MVQICRVLNSHLLKKLKQQTSFESYLIIQILIGHDAIDGPVFYLHSPLGGIYPSPRWTHPSWGIWEYTPGGVICFHLFHIVFCLLKFISSFQTSRAILPSCNHWWSLHFSIKFFWHFLWSWDLDPIPTSLLKQCKSVLPSITNIINLSLSTRVFFILYTTPLSSILS